MDADRQISPSAVAEFRSGRQQVRTLQSLRVVQRIARQQLEVDDNVFALLSERVRTGEYRILFVGGDDDGARHDAARIPSFAQHGVRHAELIFVLNVARDVDLNLRSLIVILSIGSVPDF
jgi:hypothetical protein